MVCISMYKYMVFIKIYNNNNTFILCGCHFLFNIKRIVHRNSNSVIIILPQVVSNLYEFLSSDEKEDIVKNVVTKQVTSILRNIFFCANQKK